MCNKDKEWKNKDNKTNRVSNKEKNNLFKFLMMIEISLESIESVKKMRLLLFSQTLQRYKKVLILNYLENFLRNKEKKIQLNSNMIKSYRPSLNKFKK
jgi:hypothetical protein